MNRNGRRLHALAVFVALCWCQWAAAQPGVMVQSTDIYDAPYRDAKVSAHLDVGAHIVLGERRGAWIKVQTPQAKGWARLFQVRAGDGAASAGSSSTLAMLWNLGRTGRSGAHGIDATTGIRGLSAEDLQTAKPNEQAVKQLENYRTSRAAAETYAKAAKLQSHDVPYIKN